MRPAAVVRALYGALLLVAPEAVIRTVADDPSKRTATVGRILGVRHLLQAFTIGRSESRGWLLVGVLVDISHALSMVAIAALSPNYRRLAALDAIVASGWALTGAWTTRRD
ncbi:MAG TPA: hypothetical protein VFJ06_07255 [Halococcus sp.]|nr:hypothetical protein [Halococcus sp.]